MFSYTESQQCARIPTTLYFDREYLCNGWSNRPAENGVIDRTIAPMLMK